MSILDEIREHVEGNSLFEIFPRDLRAVAGLEYRRWVYVSTAINGELSSRFQELLIRRLRVNFENFILGRTIAVALSPDHKTAGLARLDPSNHEVWEVRIQDANPELRVLGRFAHVDVFVALNLYEHWELKGKRKWNEAKARCRADWMVLFPSSTPVIGRTINDYISTNVTVI
jgi:hypothetical protein